MAQKMLSNGQTKSECTASCLLQPVLIPVVDGDEDEAAMRKNRTQTSTVLAPVFASPSPLKDG